MILKSLRAALLGATILAVGGAGVAIAQAPPPKHDEMGEHHMHGDPAAMMQRHAQHLRDALQLTPAQEPALQTLLSSMKPPEGAHEHMMKGGHEEMEHLTTPQRLEKMRSMMTEHMAAFDAHAQAVTRFYAQLTPTQQKAFDALSPMMMHHGMGGMHGGMGEHGMGGHEGGGHEGHPPKPPGA